MATKAQGGNFVSEWFGQRIYPDVRLQVATVSGVNSGRCPFLSDVLNARTECVKSQNSHGVCSISSVSNGSRQDWLVCPYRVIDSDIVRKSCMLIFGLAHEVAPLPVSILSQTVELEKFKSTVVANGVGYLFFQDKLGGEISVIGTAKSPELSFDVTLVEIRPTDLGGFLVSRYGILEIQTMDFHGTYKHAVSNLRDAQRLHPEDFPAALQSNQHWAGDHVEGPNIANVFKRTFYQIMLKFKLSGEGSAAAGTVLALPRSVWDSWQPFLGAPQLEDEAPGIKRFSLGRGKAKQSSLNAYICVFDLDSTSKSAVSPVKIEHFVHVSPERLAHHAFNEVPSHILHAIQTQDSVLSRIRTRMSEWWPEFQVTRPTARQTPRKK